MAIFRKTKTNRIFEDLVEQIEMAILEGRLKAGDKLPPQRELVEMFQTSRASLREALRVLEQKGLIDIKLGVAGGATVRSPGTDQVSESLALLIRHKKVSLDEIAEFREGVEGIVAALAAERAEKRDVKQLKKLLAESEELVEKGISAWKDSVEADKKIHFAIAEIAKNTVYKFVVRMVHANIDPYYEKLPERRESVLRENHSNLRDIVNAIEKGDRAEAQKLAQSHVRRFHRYMGSS